MAHLDKTKKMHTVSEVSFFIDGWLACSCHPFISWLTPIDTNSAAEKKTDKQMYHLPAAFTVTCPSEILYVCVCVGEGENLLLYLLLLCAIWRRQHWSLYTKLTFSCLPSYPERIRSTLYFPAGWDLEQDKMIKLTVNDQSSALRGVTLC